MDPISHTTITFMKVYRTDNNGERAEKVYRAKCFNGEENLFENVKNIKERKITYKERVEKKNEQL